MTTAKAAPVDPRRRVLAQWRGVDTHDEEIARTRGEKPVNAVLAGVLKSLRLDARQAEAEIVKVWNQLLDPTLTAHAQPTGLRQGTLFVAVDSNVWLAEIVRYRRREILDRLQHSFGPDRIKKISFRLG